MIEYVHFTTCHLHPISSYVSMSICLYISIFLYSQSCTRDEVVVGKRCIQKRYKPLTSLVQLLTCSLSGLYTDSELIRWRKSIRKESEGKEVEMFGVCVCVAYNFVRL